MDFNFRIVYMPPIFDKAIEKEKEMRGELQSQVRGYIMTGIGLIVALSWNDAIKAFIDYIYPAEGKGITAKFIYAIVLTLIVIVISRIILREKK